MVTDLITRAATVTPATFNPQTRSVSATIATETPVPRRDRRGPVMEVLTASGLDVAASQNVPILDVHNINSVRATLGRVTSVRVENGEVVADLVFSAADDVAPVLQRIADGTIRGLSVGYRVTSRRAENRDGRRFDVITGWQLMEVSVTSNPLDVNATFRAGTSTNKPEATMADNQDAGITPAEDKKLIRSLVRNAELEPELADEWIDKGMSITSVRAELHSRMEAKAADKPKATVSSVGPSNDDPDVILTRAARGMAVRMGGSVDEKAPDFGAIKPYIGMTFADMAVDCLSRSGESLAGITPINLWHQRAAALSTSDFPALMAEASSIVLLETYRQAQSPLKALCRRVDLDDYREKNAVRLGELGDFQPVSEAGEITATGALEAGEPMSLGLFARRVVLTEKMLVNDSANAFGDVVRDLSMAAASTEAAIMALRINEPGNLTDGNPVFSATRGNVSAGAALSVGYDLGAPRKALRKRTGLSGSLIDVTPKYLLVDAEFETVGERLLAQIQPTEIANANPFSRRLELVVEPRLTDESAFVVADPGRSPGLAYHYLTGQGEGPQIERNETFDNLNISWRGVLRFGCSWIDWRSWQKITA